jgi:iron complex outermembrane receptor protein
MSTFDPLLNTNTNLYANLPKATIKGIEVETTWQPIDRLQILANYSYLDSRIEEACCFQDPEDPNGLQPGVKVGARQAGGAVLQDLSGSKLSGATPHRVSVNGNYTWNLGAGDLTASASYSWRSATYFSVFNRYYNKGKAYEQVDARLLWNDAGKKYTVIGFAKNIFDTRGQVVMGGTRLANTGPNFGAVDQNVSFIPPRSYGVELQYRF